MEIHPQEAGTRLCAKRQAESHAHSYVHTERDTTLTTTQHYVYTHTYMYTILYIHVVVHYTIHSSRQQDVQCTKRQVVHSGTLCSSRQSTCAGVRSLAARQRGTVKKSLRTCATHTTLPCSCNTCTAHSCVHAHTYVERGVVQQHTCTVHRERHSVVVHIHVHTQQACAIHTHVYIHTHTSIHIHTHTHVCIHTSIYVLYYTSHYYTIVILYYYYHNNTPIQKPYIGARTVLARLTGPIVDLAQKRLAKSVFILCNFFSRKA